MWCKDIGGESLSNQLDRDKKIVFAYEVPVVCIPTSYTDNDTDLGSWTSVEQWQYLLTQKLIKQTKSHHDLQTPSLIVARVSTNSCGWLIH